MAADLEFEDAEGSSLRDRKGIRRLRLRLKRTTSINSNFQTHKEKEMADFRKLFYALALVAMLAGLTVPVSAQAPPFQCIANAGVPPIIRGEGYAELVGDLTLNCTGGISTVAGQTVPPVNFTILLNTNITSKLTTTLGVGGWNEALLIIDEPHSPVNTARPILNCGLAGVAPDNGVSGPGVCAITSVGIPAATYDGCPPVPGAPGTGEPTGVPVCTTGTYGTGRPNVFQGRTGTLQNPGQYNAVTWNGVPLDPPGTTTNRTIRFTNIRADAVFLGVSSTFTTNYVQAQISVNGNTSLSINNPQQIVAFVQKGLIVTTSTINAAGTGPLVAGTPVTFLQCNSQNALAVTAGTGGVIGSTGALAGGFNFNSPGSPVLKFTEGFASSWKAKNISFIINQAVGSTTGNGKLQPGAAYWTWNGTTNYPADLNQNVPGAIYNTETGFENVGTVGSTLANDPNPNPPFGVGTTPVVSVPNNGFSSTSTGIASAGIATQGTRLAVQITSIPNGVVVFVPTAISLTNSVGATGIAVLTTTAADGSGGYSPVSTANPVPTTTYVPISGGLAVYEVLFADPFSIESASVPIIAGWVTNLSTNLPQPGITAQGAGSFAPFYSTAAAHNPSSTLPVPRFVPGLSPVNLFSMVKCACDILFPWVVSAGGFDTGIAFANTSLDPGAAFGFGASPQSGAVQFWYYGVGSSSGGPPPATQCTNTTSPGTCPGTTTIPAGQTLAYAVSQGSTQWGLTPVPFFYGYVIAQAAFQYCHAFAYISALGAGPLTTGVSEGYLGLILDPGGLSRTGQTSENLVQ
jgi:hypothetical protein